MTLFSEKNICFRNENSFLYLRKKVKVFCFRCVKHCCSSLFYNVIFYTQLVFIFHVLGDFYIVRNCIVVLLLLILLLF